MVHISSGATSGLSQEGQSLVGKGPTSQNSEKMLKNDDESLDVVDVHVLDKKTKTPRKKQKNFKLKNTKYQMSAFSLPRGQLVPLPPVSYATTHITFKVEWLKDPNLRS